MDRVTSPLKPYDYLLIFLLMFSFLLSACAGARTRRINNCVPRVSLTSTDDVLFHMVFTRDGPDGSSSFSRLKRKEGEYFLAVHSRSGNKSQRLPGEASGQRVESLPTGTLLTFDGIAAIESPIGVTRIGGGEDTRYLRAEAAGYTAWVPVVYFSSIDIASVDAANREALIALGLFDSETLKYVLDWHCPSKS